MSSDSENLTNDQKLMLGLVEVVSKKYKLMLLSNIIDKKSTNNKKKEKRMKFLESVKVKRLRRRERMKIKLIVPMIRQAIMKGIPLREPKRKLFSKPELTPLIYQTIEQSDEIKAYPSEETANFDSKISAVEFVPDMIYLQRLDADNSKMLVKLVVNWGYLEDNQLHLFLNSKNEEISENKLLVFKQDKELHGTYPIKHASNFQNDEEETAKALFVGLITDLKPNSKYWYRIECYHKKTNKLIAATNNISFKTSFNLDENNKPLFLVVNSDLHGGRAAKFMRGKVQGKRVAGNLDLVRLFNNIASTEDEVTFNNGYAFTVSTGDLTENASYSEYWVDLIKRCTVLWNHVPVLTAIGNHDYYCGGIGRGNMAGGFEEDCRYFHRWITNPNSSSGNLPGHWYSIDQGNVHAVFLDSNGMGWGKYKLNCSSEQWLWLKEDLKNWRERLNKGENVPQFCIVFLHSAIFSLGFWGRGFNRGNDEKVQTYLTPLFRKYGVDLVLFGHDHIYQRSNWMNTVYIENGRGGGSTRPFFYWKKRKTVYEIDRIVKDWHTRIYTTIYIPPNKTTHTNKQENDFTDFKLKIRNDLLSQPTASNYFFGERKINQKLGKMFDNNYKLKEKLIDKLILPKLDDHIWIRAYAVEKKYHTGFREIIDMCFIKVKDHNIDDYEINCPEKVVE